MKPLIALLVALLPPLTVAAEDVPGKPIATDNPEVQRLETADGTTIIGTKEAPAVLNVVPWQGRELQADPNNIRPPEAQSVLEDSLRPIDRDVLIREVDYFNLLKGVQ